MNFNHVMSDGECKHCGQTEGQLTQECPAAVGRYLQKVGFRVIFNKNRTIARVDSPDWRESTGKNNMHPHMYRSHFSGHVIVGVPDDVIKHVRMSVGDKTEYVPADFGADLIDSVFTHSQEVTRA